jgi:predicted RecB family nuclease
MNTRSQKTCRNGHQYYKSSACPVCPICENERKPTDSFLAKLGAPARRAFEREGIATLEQLSAYSEKEIRTLHGVGPSTIPILKQVLELAGLDFKPKA